MASTKQTIVVLFSFTLLALPSLIAAIEFNTTKKPPQKNVDVIVEGVVYCQSCDRQGSWSLTGAKPLPSAKVSVICKNYKQQVIFYKVWETNAKGYFYAALGTYKMTHHILDHPLQACKVKLVSSPLPHCNLLTNINYGLYGASLRYENKIISGNNYKAVVYSAGPLAFRPDVCLPKTHG